MLFDKLRRIHRTLAFSLTVLVRGYSPFLAIGLLFLLLQIASILRERTDEAS